MCFDRKGAYSEIVAALLRPNGVEEVTTFYDDGRYYNDDTSPFDLMMADDDYMEKLARGEYVPTKDHKPYLYDATNDVWQQPHIIMGPEVPVWQEPHRIMTPEDTAKVAFLSPFDETYWRQMYAGMAMQGLCAAHGTSKSADHIARGAVECADALIEKLKKEKA